MKNKAPFDCTASRPIPGQLDSLCGHLGFFNMMKIYLTRNLFALVDNEDFDYLNKFKWHAHKNGNTSYARTPILDHTKKGGQAILNMHRIIMNCPDNMQIDHINHNGLDNRKENLRIVTKRENHWNRVDQSLYIGVIKSHKKFCAMIRVNNKRIYLGIYLTPEEAHNAYMNYASTLIKHN
jgi:hypothetical protein